MDDTYATIEVVKQKLDQQLLEAFSESDILIDCSDKLNNLAHVVIFVSQKYSKKSKPQPMQYAFSSELILDIESNPLVCPEFMLRMAITNDPNGLKFAKLRSLSRRIFSITKSFCKQYELPLVMVPFETVFSDDENDFVITDFPKFENLRFVDLKNRNQYMNINDFFVSEMNKLNRSIDLIKAHGFWNNSKSSNSEK